MDLTSNVVINIYSISILIIIAYHSSKQAEEEEETLHYKLFMLMLKITVLLLALDIFSRFDGMIDPMFPVANYIGNFLVFMLSPILPSLWLLYVHCEVFQDVEKTKWLFYPLIAINAVHAIMVVLSQFFGWLYYIDSNNNYHRGPLFLVSTSITVVLIIIAFIIIIVNRKKIKRKHYLSLAFFAVPPSLGIALQIVFYGISLTLNSVVLSFLIVFLNIQNNSIYIDYLTGVYNRKKLELYLKEKINSSSENKTFSAIMIDLNDFKSINDTFGHDAGDNALQISAKLLNSCLRTNDFIARFGGDEFVIVLDISNRIDMEDVVCRINSCAAKYNESSDCTYKISFCMGYAVYNYSSHMKIEEFLKKIDVLMYKNKHANKKLKGAIKKNI